MLSYQWLGRDETACKNFRWQQIFDIIYVDLLGGIPSLMKALFTPVTYTITLRFVRLPFAVITKNGEKKQNTLERKEKDVCLSVCLSCFPLSSF